MQLGMPIMDLAFLFLLLVGLPLPFHWAVTRQLVLSDSPEYLRRCGVVVWRRDALDATGRMIGHYDGLPVFESVTFRTMEYDFVGVVMPRRKRPIGENELYLDPGLLYRHRDAGGGRGSP